FRVSLNAHAHAGFLWWDWDHDWNLADLVNYHKDHGQPGISISGDERGLDDLRHMTHVTAARWPNGRLELFAIGEDGLVYHGWQRDVGSSAWSAWGPMKGGNLHARGLAVGLNQHNNLEVFPIGSDGQVYRQWFYDDDWEGRWVRTGDNIRAASVTVGKAPD